jgi:hypothetical protein
VMAWMSDVNISVASCENLSRRGVMEIGLITSQSRWTVSKGPSHQLSPKLT